jgi:uncharacterized lipoprotein YmbA
MKIAILVLAALLAGCANPNPELQAAGLRMMAAGAYMNQIAPPPLVIQCQGCAR